MAARRGWLNMSAKGPIRTAAGAAIVAAGVGMFGWLFLIGADIFTAWWTYATMSGALEAHGWEENLATLGGIAFMLLFTVVMHGLVKNILARKTMDATWQIAIVTAVWAAAMFASSYQFADAIYNPYTKQARYKYYRGTAGELVKIPKGAKIGPEGQTVLEFDAKSTQEYMRQEKPKATKSVSISEYIGRLVSKEARSNVVTLSSSDGGVNYWVERIVFTRDLTEIHMASSMASGMHGKIYPFDDGSYLADTTGRIYRQTGSDIRYDQEEKNWWSDPVRFKIVRMGEVFHFRLRYQPADEVPGSLDLYYHRFPDKLNLDWELGWADATPLANSKIAANAEDNRKFFYAGLIMSPDYVPVRQLAGHDVVQVPAPVQHTGAVIQDTGTEVPAAADPVHTVTGLGNLSYWVEQVTFKPKSTEVYMGCKWNGTGIGKIFAVHRIDSYATDETGRRYELTSSKRTGLTPKDPGDAMLFSIVDYVWPCHITLNYSAVQSPPEALYVHDIRFDTMRVYSGPKATPF